MISEAHLNAARNAARLCIDGVRDWPNAAGSTRGLDPLCGVGTLASRKN